MSIISGVTSLHVTEFTNICRTVTHLPLNTFVITIHYVIGRLLQFCNPGADPGGGGSWGLVPPPPFGGPPNLIKLEKTACVCAQIWCILVLLQSPRPPPPSKILYPPLVTTTHVDTEDTKYTDNC